MTIVSKAHIARISAQVVGVEIPDQWHGVDAVLPLLERMRQEGAVVLLKWDGERRAESGELPCTCIVQGGCLGDEFFRAEAAAIEEVLCQVIESYAERVWRDSLSQD